MAQCRSVLAVILMIIIGIILHIGALSGHTLNGFEIENPLVPAKQILPGGPPRDGIPAIDNPKFIEADEV